MEAPESLTIKQEALGPQIGPGAPGLLTNNQGAPGPLTDDLKALGPLTDDQGYRARSPAIQIFNKIHAKPEKNLKILCLKLQSQALV